MKEKIAITIDDKLLARLDRAVDGDTIRNRSHAIEYFLGKALGAKAEKALIIGGHKDFSSGTLFEGRLVIEHQVELLKTYGVKKVVLFLHKDDKKVQDILGDGSGRGINITYLRQNQERLGTAYVIFAAKKLLGDDLFFVMYSHVVGDIDLGDFAAYHTQADATATIALTSIEDPSLYGAVKMRGEKVVSFQEKPKAKEGVSRVISAGMFCFGPEIFDYIPTSTSLSASKQKVASLEKDVFPKLAREGKLAGYLFEGKWCNVRNQICFPAKKKK